MSFEEQIKSWVSIDNEIRVQNDILKKLRAKRNDTGDSIIQYVETENLHNATIKASNRTDKKGASMEIIFPKV